MRSSNVVRLLALLLLLAATPSAFATQVARIARIFSTQDGLAQFVELGVSDVAGAAPTVATSLRIRDGRGAMFNALPLPADVLATSRTSFVIAFDTLCRISCDFVPYGDTTADLAADSPMLPTGGGTIELVGAGGVSDSWAYPALPDDGRTMLDRDNGAIPAVFHSTATQPIAVDAPFVLAIEFVHAGTGSYFLASRADEIRALDRNDIPGWNRTGQSLDVLVRPSRNAGSASGGERSLPICRFLLSGATGFAHFFSASPAECDGLRAAGATLESDAIFHLAQPDPVTGDCPILPIDMADGTQQNVRTAEVYRFWDGRVDPPRHRLVRVLAIRDQMLAQGWIPEGYGPRGVALCL